MNNVYQNKSSVMSQKPPKYCNVAQSARKNSLKSSVRLSIRPSVGVFAAPSGITWGPEEPF